MAVELVLMAHHQTLERIERLDYDISQAQQLFSPHHFENLIKNSILESTAGSENIIRLAWGSFYAVPQTFRWP
jgi:hypothetical protein